MNEIRNAIGQRAEAHAACLQELLSALSFTSGQDGFTFAGRCLAERAPHEFKIFQAPRADYGLVGLYFESHHEAPGKWKSPDEMIDLEFYPRLRRIGAEVIHHGRSAVTIKWEGLTIHFLPGDAIGHAVQFDGESATAIMRRRRTNSGFFCSKLDLANCAIAAWAIGEWRFIGDFADEYTLVRAAELWRDGLIATENLAGQMKAISEQIGGRHAWKPWECSTNTRPPGIEPDTLVEIMTKGEAGPIGLRASNVDWQTIGSDGDVLRYRLVEKQA